MKRVIIDLLLTRSFYLELRLLTLANDREFFVCTPGTGRLSCMHASKLNALLVGQVKIHESSIRLEGIPGDVAKKVQYKLKQSDTVSW